MSLNTDQNNESSITTDNSMKVNGKNEEKQCRIIWQVKTIIIPSIVLQLCKIHNSNAYIIIMDLIVKINAI